MNRVPNHSSTQTKAIPKAVILVSRQINVLYEVSFSQSSKNCTVQPHWRMRKKQGRGRVNLRHYSGQLYEEEQAKRASTKPLTQGQDESSGIGEALKQTQCKSNRGHSPTPQRRAKSRFGVLSQDASHFYSQHPSHNQGLRDASPLHYARTHSSERSSPSMHFSISTFTHLLLPMHAPLHHTSHPSDQTDTTALTCASAHCIFSSTSQDIVPVCPSAPHPQE